MSITYKILEGDKNTFLVQKTTRSFWSRRTKIEKLKLYIFPANHRIGEISHVVDLDTGETTFHGLPNLCNVYRAYQLNEYLRVKGKL